MKKNPTGRKSFLPVSTTALAWFYEGSTVMEKFRISVNGRTLTITRIHADEGWNCDDPFSLRAYLRTEDIPDFTSTVYTYWGLEGERAPLDPTKVNFHRPSLSSRQVLSINVNPCCGSQYLTPSYRLKGVPSLIVIP